MDYRAAVATALQATVIHSPTSYSWFGVRVQELPPEIEQAMSATDARDYLLYRLQAQLYNDFYCRGGASPSAEPQGQTRNGVFTPFVEALSAANVGMGSREPGWVVRAADHREIVVERDGLRVWVRRDEVYASNGAIVPGAQVRVRLPKELMNLFPGFYMALGNEGLELQATEPLIRFYWNVSSEGAPRLVRALTERLNSARLPFRLKVVNDPERFIRCDAAVLYVRKRDHLKLVRLVRTTFGELASQMRPLTPMFTRDIAPGLGFAEDPGGSDSFGTHRCRLLADGIIRSYESGCHSVADQLRTIEAEFAGAGISLDKPYLNAGSSDLYAFGAV
jgi:hypothetical protein